MSDEIEVLPGIVLDTAALCQNRMNAAIDEVLDCLDFASAHEVEIDPLATIIERVKARGAEIDLSTAPPLMQMLLSGMLDG